jgi:Flp pilus assembly pilin Flp
VTILLRTLWRETEGQDLIEYTLLITFVVIVCAGIVGFGGESIRGIVSVSTNQVDRAAVIAGS